jgi:hypothetical protein
MGAKANLGGRMLARHGPPLKQLEVRATRDLHLTWRAGTASPVRCPMLPIRVSAIASARVAPQEPRL